MGMVDDYGSQLRPPGYNLSAVTCRTKVMIAREDTSRPPAHGYWLVDHLPNADAWVVDGGHMGPRDQPEEGSSGGSPVRGRHHYPPREPTECGRSGNR